MLKATFYIESQGPDEKVVKTSIENLTKSVKKEPGCTIIKAVTEDIAEEEGNYSTSLELDLEFEGLQEYLIAAMRFAPYAIIFDSPTKLSLTADEFVKTIANITAFTKIVFRKHGIRATLSKAPEDKQKNPDDYAGEEGKLTEEEIEGYLDQGALRVKIVVQAEGSEEEATKNLLSTLGYDVFVHKMKASNMGDKTLVAFHAFMYEPKTLAELSIKLIPILIELIEPETVELSMLQMQDMGLELASAYFELAHLAYLNKSPS
ncbi:MAG TPA: hypothetical protein ENH13_00135 [Euryarchaeota archaeon]|nr:hypothetical protein [Euryarchaeota archaeon]